MTAPMPQFLRIDSIAKACFSIAPQLLILHVAFSTSLAHVACRLILAQSGQIQQMTNL